MLSTLPDWNLCDRLMISYDKQFQELRGNHKKSSTGFERSVDSDEGET